MANVCEISGKRKLKGNRVSHANNKSTHYQQPNIQARHIYIPELGQKVSIKVSTSGLRTIDKSGGISRYLIKTEPSKLSPSLQRVRNLILKKGLK